MPYMASILFGVGVLAIETVVFKLYQRERFTWPRAMVLIVVANVASFIVGLLISGIMPSGIERNGRTSPRYIMLVHIAFLWAFLLSWAVELAVIKMMSKGTQPQRLIACVGTMNATSYAVLWIFCTLLWG